MKKWLIHISLFVFTFLTTTLAGVQWQNRDPLEITNLLSGILYSSLLILILLAHELGHYIAARFHGVDATLPFFIPFPSFLLGIAPFGTLGAVIRIKSAIVSRKVLFDIGSAGPISGFVISLVVLVIGFSTLPNIEFLYQIHPEYRSLESIPTTGLTFGNNIAFFWAGRLAGSSGAFVPPMNEIYHYPLLCVGWFGLLVTAMNLIPVGQLDGGHIARALFGNTYHRIAQGSLFILVILGTFGFFPFLGVDVTFGWTGWLFWALVLALLIRVGKGQRSSLDDSPPLDRRRKVIGWLCAVILLVSFVPVPIQL
jgi:membrane-associated protease RseP (regulator of RpoE activity)